MIDPWYFFHPYDGQVLLKPLRFNRRLLATMPIQALGVTKTLPGAATWRDEEMLTFVKGVTSTGYHYSGTCAMLVKALEGVVDSELKVHGVDILRIVVNASIMPLSQPTLASGYYTGETVPSSNRYPTASSNDASTAARRHADRAAGMVCGLLKVGGNSKWM
ncbi:GMC oxidoreductase [Colletotrichum graminicola M1.001]|uniref:GMC oxidoreductase n=1 Tax=Colletotrichum graminicola (strain M1.001 / M2 / FGSC 10212) TaxID=645133 RepID=E3QL08_COLGM|nr:GMC oxidoreductase [Colletotrichum graminicola M1.001]EFQ31546.1 GMC oxidoreductase [Colletotrichum graminicola M1.001]